MTEGSAFHTGGYTAPFDLAILALCIGLALIVPTWEENYGEEDGEESNSLAENLRSAGHRLLFDSRTLLSPCTVSQPILWSLPARSSR